MRLFLIVVLATLLCAVPPARAQWTEQELPSDITLLLSVDFADSSVGIAGGHRVTGDFFGRAVWTTDGGATWSLAAVPAAARALVEVQMLDPLQGIAGGAENLPPRSGARPASPAVPPGTALRARHRAAGLTGTENYRGMLFRTTDGGRSWASHGTLPDSVSYVLGIAFPTRTTGYLIASLSATGTPSAILKSTNGGMSWKTMLVPDSGATLSGMAWRDSLLGVAVGFSGIAGAGVIHRITSGGDSGTVQYVPEVVEFSAVDFADDSTVFVTGNTGIPGTGVIYRSTDAGGNWQPLSYQPPMVVLDGVDFPGQSARGVVYSSLFSFATSSNAFAASANGGSSWTEYPIHVADTGTLILDHDFLTPDLGYLSGGIGAGWPTRGLMLRTLTGGVTSVSDPAVGVPGGARLLAPWPNPFNGSVQIAFDIQEATDVRVSVLDILGREVAVPAAGRVYPGRHRTVWDAGAASSGTYLVRLRTAQGMAVQRILLIR